MKKSICKYFSMLFKPYVFWDWYDVGFVLKISKQNNTGKYHFAIDIQLLWFDLWVQCWRKKEFR